MRPAPLERKVLRDLWRMRWQLMAIALLIACGVSVAVMSFSAQRALSKAEQAFYSDTAFADVFATLKRAPLSVARELSSIDGVTTVDARLVQAGLMNLPGLTRPATVRLISLPEDDSGGLNRITVTRGRLPDPAHFDEVVALETFMTAAEIEMGQKLPAVIAGRSCTFTVVGAALSPEFVYVPSPESFMPDDAHQAILWARRPTVERVAGLTGGFNSVSLRLAAGSSTGPVLSDLDRRLASYGGRASFTRADQPSHVFLDAELKELSTSASILPPIFLIVAAALVHLVVSRLVEAEREQIGLFKAFGYSDREAASPYLYLAATVGMAGAISGGLAGAALGAAIVELYREYFRFPILQVSFHWPAFLISTAIAIAAALGGSFVAVRNAARLSPAVAMQPPSPPAYRAGPLDSLLQRTDQATRMIVRHFERFPGRAALACLGLASSLALLVGTQFLFDSLDKVVDQTYFRTSRWTETVSFQEARAAGSMANLSRLPGVFAAEPVRAVTARLRGNGRAEMTRLVGLSSDASLQRPLDGRDQPIRFKGDGLILSEALAGRLGLHAGDSVWVEAIEGRGPQTLMMVDGLARDYSGFSAYIDRRALNRWMGEGDVINAAQLLVAGDQRPAFYKAVEAIPQIIGASSRDETVAAWRLAMAEAFRMSITFYVGFAAAIAFGVAFNTMRTSLSERSRDLATLHVLGFGHWGCAYILGGELLLLALAAIPLGILGGEALAHGLVAAYSRDEVRLPAVISARSFGAATAAYLIAVAVGAALVLRRIWRLDLVTALKTRE